MAKKLTENKERPELTDVGERWNRQLFERSEVTSLLTWLVIHFQECKCKGIVIAQSSASGIGTNTVIRCTTCNKSKDITDYTLW
jgi:hypothetical protein